MMTPSQHSYLLARHRRVLAQLPVSGSEYTQRALEDNLPAAVHQDYQVRLALFQRLPYLARVGQKVLCFRHEDEQALISAPQLYPTASWTMVKAMMAPEGDWHTVTRQHGLAAVRYDPGAFLLRTTCRHFMQKVTQAVDQQPVSACRNCYIVQLRCTDHAAFDQVLALLQMRYGDCMLTDPDMSSAHPTQDRLPVDLASVITGNPLDCWI